MYRNTKLERLNRAAMSKMASAKNIGTMGQNEKDESNRLDVLAQQNSEFWTKIKALEKTVAERDEEINRLKKDLQKTSYRAETAEQTLNSVKSTLQKVQSDNETLTATLKTGGNADPLGWKKQYEETSKRYEELRWDNWLDHCRARGRDPYD